MSHQAQPVTGFRRIDAATAADLILRHRRGQVPELAIFDVRDAASFQRGHVEGARHLAEAGFGAAIKRLPRSTPVLIYCYHGNASQAWGGMFADFRYPEVYSVDGGYEPLAAALVAPVAGPPALSAALAELLTAHRSDPANLDAPGDQGLTPLMRAALLGRVDLVDELLALGVDLQRRNGDGNNALWLACVGRHEAVAARLASAGIDLGNQNDAGATCLMYAASSGRAEMVAWLLAAGADPNLRNQDDARAVDLCATLPCLKLLRAAATNLPPDEHRPVGAASGRECLDAD
jgi:rhodanese-related sulfurtransferase